MRWSECYICGAEEDTKINSNDIIVEIFECSKCGEEYCNNCGDINEPYQCNKCKSDNRIKRIDEHFYNMTIEEYEKNLIKCGIDVIEPSNKSGFKLK